MRYLFFIVFVISTSQSFSQILKGKIYDQEATVKGAFIINLKKNDTAYSDLKGNFKIHAIPNDTLLFVSLFHHQKKVTLKAHHFKDTSVFELKKKINELNEVLLSSEKEQPFNLEEFQYNTSFSIAQDIKNNPHLYMPKEAYSGGIKLGPLIKLLGLKKKKKKTIQKPITSHHIDSLFSNNKLFKREIVINQLSIPKEYVYLFFEYCETKQLSKDLLIEQNHIILLDSIFKIGQEFQMLLKDKKK